MKITYRSIVLWLLQYFFYLLISVYIVTQLDREKKNWHKQIETQETFHIAKLIHNIHISVKLGSFRLTKSILAWVHTNYYQQHYGYHNYVGNTYKNYGKYTMNFWSNISNSTYMGYLIWITRKHELSFVWHTYGKKYSPLHYNTLNDCYPIH